MKNLFLLTLLLIFSAIYAQDNENQVKVRSFEVNSNSKKELQNFDWKKVKKSFKENAKQDSIKIVIDYNELSNNSESPKNKNIFKTEIKGQTSELGKMIKTSKKLIREFLKD